MNYGLEIELLTADKNRFKACFDAAQEQAVKLAGEVDRLRDALEKSHAEADALKRLRDELIELIRQQNEGWHRRCKQLNRDIDELRELAGIADERLDKKCVECGDLQTAINNALELVNKDCPSMDRFTNIVPTVAWLLQKWRECRERWQAAVAKSIEEARAAKGITTESDDAHHAMMNGPRVALPRDEFTIVQQRNRLDRALRWLLACVDEGGNGEHLKDAISYANSTLWK